jgi:arginine decarboxylase
VLHCTGFFIALPFRKTVQFTGLILSLPVLKKDMPIIPTRFFFVKGVGTHEKDMRAFEEALRDAGVHMCNLVKISSVIPPGCKRISTEEGKRRLRPGSVIHAVIAESQTNEPGQLVGAAIGMAQPKGRERFGYLTEVESAIGREAEDLQQDVEEMALENLVTEMGFKFDGDKIMRRGKKNYDIRGNKIAVDSIVETARGEEGNKYTVVFVAAIMLTDE